VVGAAAAAGDAEPDGAVAGSPGMTEPAGAAGRVDGGLAAGADAVSNW
jgi:hypothetical protein